MKPNELKTLKDFINYWQSVISQLNNKNQLGIAAKMMAVVVSNNFDEFYEGPKSNTLFAEVFDLAAELDGISTPKYYRDAQWGMLKASLRLLAEQQTKLDKVL